MADQFQQNVNLYTKNKYAIVFSNVPNLTPFPDDELNLSSFGTTVKSVNLPSRTLNILHSYWQHKDQIHPNTQGARESNVLTIDWLLDSMFINYLVLVSLLEGTKFGIPARSRNEDDERLVRDNCIDCIDIYALDNAKIPRAKLSFYRAFLTGVGDLPLEFGESENVRFQTTFNYENFGVTFQKKKPDGSWLIEPLNPILLRK